MSGGALNLNGAGAIASAVVTISGNGALTTDGDGIADTAAVSVAGANGILRVNGADTIGSLTQTGGFVNGTSTPVSYTHLDVYKRQFVSNATLIVDGANSSVTLSGSEEIGALLGNSGADMTGTLTLDGASTVLTLNGSTFDSRVAGLVTGTGAVSYTHLDVYKRQGVGSRQDQRAAAHFGQIPGVARGVVGYAPAEGAVGRIARR